MISVSLRTFLETGKLGPLHLGMSRQQILEVVGQPDDWNTNFAPRAAIWKYGSMELYFLKGGETLYMIFCDNLNELTGGTHFQLDPWLFSPDLTLATAVSALQTEALPFTQSIEPKSGIYTVQLASGVELQFQEFGTEAPVMLAAFLYKDFTLLPRVSTKQLSVTITEEEYEQLRQMAVRQRESMSKIASAWVSERIAAIASASEG